MDTRLDVSKNPLQVLPPPQFSSAREAQPDQQVIGNPGSVSRTPKITATNQCVDDHSVVNMTPDISRSTPVSSAINDSIGSHSVNSHSTGNQSIGNNSIDDLSSGKRSIGNRSIGSRSIDAHSIGSQSIDSSGMARTATEVRGFSQSQVESRVNFQEGGSSSSSSRVSFGGGSSSSGSSINVAEGSTSSSGKISLATLMSKEKQPNKFEQKIAKRAKDIGQAAVALTKMSSQSKAQLLQKTLKKLNGSNAVNDKQKPISEDLAMSDVNVFYYSVWRVH